MKTKLSTFEIYLYIALIWSAIFLGVSWVLYADITFKVIGGIIASTCFLALPKLLTLVVK